MQGLLASDMRNIFALFTENIVNDEIEKNAKVAKCY